MHSGRESGPGSGAGNRRLCTDGAATTDEVRGARCAGLTFAAELNVHVPASARCPAGIPGAGRPGKGGCGDGWAGGPGERDACRAGGRSGRGPPARSSVRCSAPGTRAEMWPSCWSARSSVILSGTAARVLPVRRSRSGPGAALSGLRSPIAPGRGRRSCVLRAVMRKAARGFSSLRARRRGGAGGGGRMVTWFEIRALLRPMQHSAVFGKGLNSPDVVVSGS
jgi:hypothetical protein